jgi:hypothetical protein
MSSIVMFGMISQASLQGVDAGTVAGSPARYRRRAVDWSNQKETAPTEVGAVASPDAK